MKVKKLAIPGEHQILGQQLIMLATPVKLALTSCLDLYMVYYNTPKKL